MGASGPNDSSIHEGPCFSCTMFTFGVAGPLIGLVLAVLVVLVGDQRGFVEAAEAFFGQAYFGQFIGVLLFASYLAGILPAVICGATIAFFDRRQIRTVPRWLLALLAGCVATACVMPMFLAHDSSVTNYVRLLSTYALIGACSGLVCHFLTVRFSRHSRDKLGPQLRSD